MLESLFEDLIKFYPCVTSSSNASNLSFGNTSTGTTCYYSYHQTNPSFPPIRITQQKDNKYISIKFAIAGFSKDDVSIVSEDEYLIVRGEMKESSEKPDDVYVIKDNLKLTKFEKCFSFPDNYFDFRNPIVSLNNGMLEIQINKNPDLISEKKEIKII